MFIGKHPAQYFDILIVTPLVLESSTSVPVCRHEIPNRPTVASCVFVGHRIKHTVSY